MYKPLFIFIGLRYTRARRRNHFISFISAASIAGITLGVAVLIVVLSVLNGFDRELRNRILGTVPHALLEFPTGLETPGKVLNLLNSEGSIEASAPLNQGRGLLVANGFSSSVLLAGIDPAVESNVSILPGHLIEGKLQELEKNKYRVILGVGIKRVLNVSIGDYVTLIIPDASLTIIGNLPRMRRLKVVGIFEVGAQLDRQIAVIHFSDSARLFRLPDLISGFRLKFKNLFDAPAEIERIAELVYQKAQIPVNYSDWTKSHGNLFEAIRMEKTMIGLLLALIVAVAAFNIVSTLVMVVTDKKSDIAILKTIGMTPRSIMGIFIVQGSAIGLSGTLLGILFGIPLALHITEIMALIEGLFGFYLFNPEAYFISNLPSELKVQDLILIGGLSLTLSFLATIYPAYKASRVVPAEVLNHA